MKHVSALFGLFLMTAAPIFAQPGTTDSLYFYRQSARSLDYAHANVASLLADSVQRVATLGLRFDGLSGSLRPVQEAQDTYSLALQTKGIRTLGRFKVAGSFVFARQWEDSLAWDQRGTHESLRPYYFGSIKAGAFERQRYHLKGVATYALLEDKLFLSGGADLLYHESSRSVDPRPQSSLFSLAITPGITYRLGGHLLGLAFRAGYGDEETRISYKSEIFLNSPPPDRVNYFLLGYGSFINYHLGAGTRYRKDRNYRDLQLNYAGNWANWAVRSDLSYGTEEETTAIPLEQSVRDSTFGVFHLDNYRFTLLATRATRNVSRQWYLTAFRGSGRDFFEAFQASNYRYTQSLVTLDHRSLSRVNENRAFEWGVALRFEDLERHDIVSSHYSRSQGLQTTVSATMHLKNKAGDHFTAGLAPQLRLPLENELSVPATQENLFTRGVIYPEHAYRSMRIGQLRMDAGYFTRRLSRQFATGVLAGFVYRHQLTGEAQAPGPIPGNSRTMFNLSVNLYL